MRVENIPEILSILDRRILEVLEAEGPLPTAALAERIGESRNRVYRACKRLEKYGYIDSTIIKRKQLLFFPVTGEMLYSGNYGRCMEVKRRLEEIINQYYSVPPLLERELSNYLNELTRSGEFIAFRSEIMVFLLQILNAIRKGGSKSYLVGLIGPRLFRVEERLWSISSTGLQILRIP
jgi:DNA-binding Lrp family transcriptional regulator